MGIPKVDIIFGVGENAIHFAKNSDIFISIQSGRHGDKDIKFNADCFSYYSVVEIVLVSICLDH